MSVQTFSPGPTPNTVRAADGTVMTAPDGWTLLAPGDAALIRRVKEAEIGDIPSCFTKRLGMSPISWHTALLMKLATWMPEWGMARVMQDDNEHPPMPPAVP